ncbi:MAG: sodium/glutamate symporter [Peptoniphilaceae bacterium]
MVFEMNMAKTLMLAILLLLLGRFIRSKVSFLVKYSIPEAVVGGLLFAILTLILKLTNIAEFNFDKYLQTFFMNVFFTASGFEAGLGLLKKAGKKVIIFLVLAAITATLQNTIAVGFSHVLGVDPKIGLMTGSIPMTGGHGNAAAFAPIAEKAGVEGAVAVAVAAATFGLVAGSLIGGPIGNFLIKKNKLEIKTSEGDDINAEILEEATSPRPLDPKVFMTANILIFIALGLGAYIMDLFKIILPGVTLPIHVMGMLGGVIIRNVFDAIKKDSSATPVPEISMMGSVSLSIFVSMAIMTMKLWDLIELAGPFIILVLSQCIFIVLFSFVTFKVMGGDYDAAIMTSGHIGFSMGAVPVSMANMQTLCDKYIYSKIAFFVVPVVGGLLSNFTNAFVITTFMNIVGIN